MLFLDKDVHVLSGCVMCCRGYSRPIHSSNLRMLNGEHEMFPTLPLLKLWLNTNISDSFRWKK